MFRNVVGSVGLSLVLGSAHGAVVLSESFAYPDGVLQTVSSGKWTGHSGATNQVNVAQGTLNLTGAKTQDVNALLSGQPYAPTGATVLYAAFDLRMTALPSRTGAYFAHFKDEADGFRGRIWALTNGAAPGLFRLGISSGSGSSAAAVLSRDLQTGMNYKVVCSLVVSNAAVSLWLDPTTEADAHVLAEPGSGVSVAAFAFRQATGIGAMAIDNLVVGTSFRDVVPLNETASSPRSAPHAHETTPAAPAPPVIVAPPATNPVSSPSPVGLVITLQPENQTVSAGQEAAFNARAQGAEPIYFQWQFNQTDIPAATNQVLRIASARPAQQGDYRLIVRNASGQATSAAARLTVLSPQPPQIISQPVSLTINQGQTASFTIAASGSAPLHYQWRFNDADISGATTSTWILTNAQPSQSGIYRVTVRNSDGSVESALATLRVIVPVAEPLPDPSQLPVIRFTNYLANVIYRGDPLANQFTEHALRSGETLTLRVLVSAPDEQPVTLDAETRGLPASARWELSETSGMNWVATFRFSPTTREAGSNFMTRLHASNRAGTNASSWWFYVPTEQEQQIVISEFLPHPAASEAAPHFNPLRRAAPAPNPLWQDEYIELVNDSARDTDLSNWALFDSEHVRHRFEAPFVLGARAALVVYGGPRVGFPPTLPAPTIWANASATGLGLNNSGGDTIILRNAEGRMVSRIVYSLIATNGSLTRFPTLQDDFVPHANVSSSATSPGVHYDGRKFSEVSAGQLASIHVAATLEHGTRVVLIWNAERDKSYSVHQAENSTGAFSILATGLRFTETRGSFALENLAATKARFYRVSVP
jgi:hypothetical protein